MPKIVGPAQLRANIARLRRRAAEIEPLDSETVSLFDPRVDALQASLKDRLNLNVDEFNSVPVAGTATAARLNEMLKNASFAFIIMTAEDEQPDGKKRAREKRRA